MFNPHVAGGMDNDQIKDAIKDLAKNLIAELYVYRVATCPLIKLAGPNLKVWLSMLRHSKRRQ